MTPVATVATYAAEVQGVAYCGWVTQTAAGSWSGCVVECGESRRIGIDEYGQTVALRPIVETHESCIVRTNSAEIVSALANFRETGAIMRDLDVSVSRLVAECDLRAVLQSEPEGMRRDAARALVRSTFAYGAEDLVKSQIMRCATRAGRAVEILRRVNRQALADALGINVRVLHSWTRRGVGLPHVDAVAGLLGLPATLVR